MKITRYRSVRIAMVTCILTSLISVMTSTSLSLLITNNIDTLLVNVVIVLGLYGLSGLFTFFRLKLQSNAGYYLRQDLSQRLDKWISGMPSREYRIKDHGEWLSLYSNDIPKVEELLLKKLLSMTSFGATAILVLVALVRIHWSVALTASFFVLPMILVPKLFRNKLTKYIIGTQEKKAEYLSKNRELLQGFFMFLENGAFSVFLKKSRKACHDYMSYVIGVEYFTAVMSGVLTFVNAISTVAGIGVLSYFVIRGDVEVGKLLAVSALIPSFGNGVMQWMSEREFYRSGINFYTEKFSMLEEKGYQEGKYLKQVFANENLLEVDEVKAEAVELFSDISVLDACVAYGERKICFPKKMVFERGKHYAVEGESGSGKSTLVKAILSEIPLSSGNVFFDDRRLSERQVFSQAAYASQETFLLTDTVKNNVDLLGELSLEEVDEMLRYVGLTSISANDMIEDNGKNLSGGEKQRLAVLRALARKKEYYIFDEVTASLDKKNQDSIEELILSLSGTVIMITHRLSENGREKLDGVISL